MLLSVQDVKRNTESVETSIIFTGVWSVIELSMVYVSSDHKHMVPSRLPDIKTSPADVTLIEVTEPR